MKEYACAIFILLFLSGCVGQSHGPAPIQNFAEKKALEEAGWARQNRIAAVKCGIGPYPVEPEAAVIVSDCVTGLVNEIVLPNAVAPSLLVASRAEAALIAREYADGKITQVEYKQKSEERLRNYQNSLAMLSGKTAY